MILIFFCICSLFAQNDNNSSDIDIFQKYEKLKNACISGADSQTITLYQQELHLALEKEIEFNNFPVTLNIYNLKQMLLDMQNACQNLDMQILTNLMASYYFSKNKISLSYISPPQFFHMGAKTLSFEMGRIGVEPIL